MNICFMNNSKSVIVITKADNEVSKIRVFNIDSGHNEYNDEMIGTYIKACDIVQNPFIEDYFIVPYNDNGVFYIRILDL